MPFFLILNIKSKRTVLESTNLPEDIESTSLGTVQSENIGKNKNKDRQEIKPKEL